MAEIRPRLPLELERYVFELAAYSQYKSIPTLISVAHRVKIWLEPILYSVVVFCNPLPGHMCFHRAHLSSAVQSPEISQHVKNLLISPYDKGSTRQLGPILTRCSAIENLSLFTLGGHFSLLPFLSAMRLRRLCADLQDLFSSVDIDFTHPLFSHITHLELRAALHRAEWDQWKGLATVPNLTHLAFLGGKSLSIFRNTLAACPKLQVLISLHVQDDPGVGLESLAHDTRFVCIPAPPFYTDWQIGAHGGEDFWVRAEKFIAQRNRYEVDRETFVVLKWPTESSDDFGPIPTTLAP
ncbi:hypothetical protein B0H12DRAFT_221117 [Mycena haematopus]|nr:hypothetical protein B0H12DRAFT_221117 [Mycena haematopus]